MTIIALFGMIALGLVIAVWGGYIYNREKTKEKSAGYSLGSSSKALGATYLMSFGGILIVLGISFLYSLLSS